MNISEKKKNILDLKHDIALNFLNIFIILIVTSFITVFIGTRDSKFWTIRSSLGIMIILILIIMVAVITFISYSKEIMNKIIHLKNQG